MGEKHHIRRTSRFPSFMVVVSLSPWISCILGISTSLLFAFSVFWDLYCAAPERRDTCDHSSEAKAFHDYVSCSSLNSLTFKNYPLICLMNLWTRMFAYLRTLIESLMNYRVSASNWILAKCLFIFSFNFLTGFRQFRLWRQRHCPRK